ncbi:MAG: LPS export ABC transporter periplasmic protein LptC [Bacteroidales bacterium]
MEAKNNVVVKNIQKNEFLETEHLIWDRNKGIIYTDVFVKITRDEEVIYGDGMTSDQNFESYKIKNASGEFIISTGDE